MRTPDNPPDIDELIQSRITELSVAATNPDFQKTVSRVRKSYYHWSKLRYISRAEGVDPELVWLMVKLGRQGQYRSLPFRGANGEPVHFVIPDLVQQELMQIDRHLSGTLLAGEEQLLSRKARERFIVNTFREEAIASSMLEGASTTRRVAKEMLSSGRKPRDRGERMVLNNYNAIQFVREHQKTPLSKEMLLTLQSILTENTLDKPDECGRFRVSEDDVVVVDPYGQVLYEPPPAHELDERIEALCTFANSTSNDDGFIHPVIRACAMHFQIGIDHPFCDGNGRTARTIFYWYMLRNGYWLFEYLPLSKLIYKGPTKYLRAFIYAETDSYDFTYFLQYKTKIIRRARDELRDYIRVKQEEVSVARVVFSADASLNYRQREVVMQAIKDPGRVFTIALHQGAFNVSYGTANVDLNKLSYAGYLVRSIGSGQRYSYSHGPRLDTVDPAS